MFGLLGANSATDTTRRVWAAGSRLLDYPTGDLLDALGDIAALAPGNPGIQTIVSHLGGQDLRRSQEEYVETFDNTRRYSLYMTYYAYGDTRRRGVALLEFKNAYRGAGAAWDDTCAELPDHLCAVLQFGATVDADTAMRLLTEHRAGLEMLRIALADWRNSEGGVGSPWHGPVRAVCDTLPALVGEEASAVRTLIAQGPPAEQVGFGYGADPALGPRGGATLISGSTIPVGAPR